jgi:hypothetical protein
MKMQLNMVKLSNKITILLAYHMYLLNPLIHMLYILIPRINAYLILIIFLLKKSYYITN